MVVDGGDGDESGGWSGWSWGGEGAASQKSLPDAEEPEVAAIIHWVLRPVVGVVVDIGGCGDRGDANRLVVLIVGMGWLGSLSRASSSTVRCNGAAIL